jgi:hypothetical protein
MLITLSPTEKEIICTNDKGKEEIKTDVETNERLL